MYYSRLITITLVLLSFFTFSQETLVKKIEGVTVTYSEVNSGSNYVFNINNTSGNTVKLTWDTKIFYSETDSKEIHKTVEVSPQTKRQVYALEKSDSQKTLNLQSSSNKKIIRIEVHNFDFKGVL